MLIWVIGRTLPEMKTGMMGLFEFEQAQALQKYGGNDVKVCYLYADNRSVKVLRCFGRNNCIKDNVDVFGSAMPVGGLPQGLFQPLKTLCMKKAVAECEKEFGKPDIIHIHFPLLTMTESIWNNLKNYNVPIFVTEHWSKVQTKEIELFRIKLLKKIVSEAEDYICVGHFLKDSIKELTNVDREISVIPNMVSPEFRPLDIEDKDKNYFDFLTAGRLVPLKRFDIVIEAFAKMFNNNPNVHLTVAGGGEMEQALRKQIEQLGMKNQIKMTGRLSHDEIAKLMQKTDCFVSASVLETFGVPFIEAWSCGKPVICVKPNAIELYVTEKNGLLVSADNSDEMGEAMLTVFNNRNQYSSHDIAEMAENQFSQRAIAGELLKRFRNACEKNNNKVIN